MYSKVDYYTNLMHIDKVATVHLLDFLQLKKRLT